MSKTKKQLFADSLIYDLNLSKNFISFILSLILIATIVFMIFILYDSYNKNGYFSFPLDDPWIHLQFAKNLNQYGAFSYYKDSIVTSGSTAPLYTLLLSLGFVFMDNEFILSYIFGILAFIGSIIFFYKILEYEFQNILLKIFGVFLFASMWKIQWSAISGMETTTAILFLLISIYFYKRRFWILFSIFAGLLLWVRPEAIIFYAAVFLDLLYKKYWCRVKNFKEITTLKNRYYKISILILLIIGFSYFIFNYLLSGTIFPNTFSAKIKYYSGGSNNYLQQLVALFSEKDLIILSVFSIIGLIVVLLKTITKKQNEMVLYAIWCTGIILAYGLFLPFLYQKGRYLFPVFPAYIILSLYGLVYFINFLHKSFKGFFDKKKYLYLISIILIIIGAQCVMATYSLKDIYAYDVKYINDRQVTTAKWLDKNLPYDAIVATHDVGAIAFYSNRKIVDMVGLVSPEMIPNIGDFRKLKYFLYSKNVTHIATLRNWFHIGNQNPIFITDDKNPEVMEVFEYNRSSEFVPQDIVKINEEAEYFLNLGNIQMAMFLLNQSINLYPDLDWTNFLVGKIFRMMKEYDRARLFFEKTLKLNPYHSQARNLLDNLK